MLSDWSAVRVNAIGTDETSSFLLPHRLQTIYNQDSVLEDFVVDSISVNPVFSDDFFDGHLAASDGSFPPLTQQQSAPSRSPEYARSEVHELFEAGLWSGPFGEAFGVSDVVVQHPIPGSEQIMTLFIGYPDYVQVLVEFESGILITDAPPHRSKIVLEWVDLHMHGKRITHVVPSHHHRDHAGGVNDYVSAGATLVVPEIAKDLYNLTGKISKLETYTDGQPFVLKDSKVEFRSFWKDENPHARDWTYGVATKAEPTDTDRFVIFSADVINPGTDARKWDIGAARQFIVNLIEAGVPRSALLVGSHGSSHNHTSTSQSLESIARIAGIDYPPLLAGDWSASRA